MSKALIVSSAEGFIIKGLETKLDGIDMKAEYSSPKMAEISKKSEEKDVIFIYADEQIGTMADALVYLKDTCNDKDLPIVVIGSKEEYEIIKSFITESLIYKFYERPLDMGVLLSDMEKFMESESQFERRKSVLIVDDDVSYMTMVMDWLKDKYRVSLANSGMEAITWLAKNHADLILLDYEMPITSGPQVLEMIRSAPATENIPVMFLTGNGDKESVKKVLSLKPVGYLLKNIQRNELRDNIANFFTSQKKA